MTCFNGNIFRGNGWIYQCSILLGTFETCFSVYDDSWSEELRRWRSLRDVYITYFVIADIIHLWVIPLPAQSSSVCCVFCLLFKYRRYFNASCCLCLCVLSYSKVEPWDWSTRFMKGILLVLSLVRICLLSMPLLRPGWHQDSWYKCSHVYCNMCKSVVVYRRILTLPSKVCVLGVLTKTL